MLIFFLLQLVAGIRNMVRQRTLLFVLLKVVEAMQSFISHRLGGSEDFAQGWSDQRLISLLLRKLLRKESRL